MKEIPVSIKNGKYKIYGQLVLPKKKSKSAVIMAHGFSDHMWVHHISDASRKLAENGFTVLKINFWGWRKNEKKLKDDTVEKEISDLETAVNFLKRKKYKRIGIVGHSLGGMVSLLLQSRKNVADAIVAWDPSNRLNRRLGGIIKIKNKKYATIDWGTEITISKKIVDEWKKLGDISDRLKVVDCPVMLITGEKSELKKDAQKFYKKLNGPKSIKIIKNADHGFLFYDQEEELMKHTLEWFKKWLK